jgi:CBS domain-containing protein
MQAANVMTFGAATIHPEASIEEAARAMLQNRISGLPVVDGSGKLVGMVTEGDLLRRQPGETDRPRWLQLLLGSPRSGERIDLGHPQTVADVMTTHVISVREDTPVSQIADLMRRHGIKRVPVLDHGKVIGIVSRADLLVAMARLVEVMPAASTEDRKLRQRVLDALPQEPHGPWRTVNVVVREGVVEVRGATTQPDLRDRMVKAARGVQGVKDVEDRMVVVGPASGRT